MAKLLEHEAKALLTAVGVAIPKGIVVGSRDEAVSASNALGYPVVLKAQVPAGKRGKAGAILFAQTAEETASKAAVLLGRTVYNYTVNQLLVETKLEILGEYYLSVFSNPASRAPTLIFSRAGGQDVEEADPGSKGFVTLDIDLLEGLRPFMVMNALRMAGVSGPALPALADMATRLYRVYRQYDCNLVEVNPVALTSRGLVAADARINLDDDALFRHPELGIAAVEEVGDRLPTRFERIAARIDEHDHRGSAHFVQMDPDGSLARADGKISIGFDGIGTGVSLTTLDELVPLGFLPKNFCDTSGNPTASKLYRITRVILSQPDIEGYIFVSCLSSQQLDNTARGIVKAFKELWPSGEPSLPCVLSFRGAWDETALDLFERHGISSSRWVRVLGRDSTERDVALAFRDLHREWRAEGHGGARP